MTDMSQCRCLLDTVVKRHVLQAWFVIPEHLGTVRRCARKKPLRHMDAERENSKSCIRHVSATSFSKVGLCARKMLHFPLVQDPSYLGVVYEPSKHKLLGYRKIESGGKAQCGTGSLENAPYCTKNCYCSCVIEKNERARLSALMGG